MFREQLRFFGEKYKSLHDEVHASKMTLSELKKSVNDRFNWLVQEKQIIKSKCQGQFAAFCALGNYTGTLIINYPDRKYDEHADRMITEKYLLNIVRKF